MAELPPAEEPSANVPAAETVSYAGSLEEILAQYLRDVDAGKSPDPQSLIAANTEYRRQLEEFFADQQGVDEMQASVRGGQLQADAAPAPILPGREILEPIVPERYQLLGEVGRGGMGIVYRARHKGLDRPVAIKITLPDSPPERFLREAQLLAKVKSPYVVTVHDF